MKKTDFHDCTLLETDFSEADLTGATFQNSNLAATIFYHTNLEKVDFRTAQNFTIDPEINKLKGARFTYDSLEGLLRKYRIVVEGN